MEDKIILRLNDSGNKYVNKAYKDAKGIIWGIPWFLFLNFILAGRISLDYSNEIPYIVFVSMSIITTLYCVFAYFLQTRKTGFYVREIRLSQDFITIETAKYLLGKDISLSKCRAKMGKFTVTNQKWFDRPWMWRETESLLLNSEGETFTVVLEFFPSETKECIMKALQEEK